MVDDTLEPNGSNWRCWVERRGEHEDGDPVPVSTARTLRIPRSSRSSGYGYRKKNGNKRTSCLNLNRLLPAAFPARRGREGSAGAVRAAGSRSRKATWAVGRRAMDGGEA